MLRQLFVLFALICLPSVANASGLGDRLELNLNLSSSRECHRDINLQSPWGRQVEPPTMMRRCFHLPHYAREDDGVSGSVGIKWQLASKSSYVDFGLNFQTGPYEKWRLKGSGDPFVAYSREFRDIDEIFLALALRR